MPTRAELKQATENRTEPLGQELFSLLRPSWDPELRVFWFFDVVGGQKWFNSIGPTQVFSQFKLKAILADSPEERKYCIDFNIAFAEFLKELGWIPGPDFAQNHPLVYQAVFQKSIENTSTTTNKAA